ncbi:hypothetical protein SEA_SWEATNTEARS_54 [Gordonia phage SweatNTears]|nr:hypothetical protein SEA_SWEATNTEARS_54 [Gordonia phage SweatNTears]
MKKTLFTAVPLVGFLLVLPACSADPEPVTPVAITTQAPASTTLEESPVTPISNDEAEEVMIQGYIKSARGLLQQGVIPRDRVTTQLILSELTYVNEDQAAQIKEAILR